MQCFARFEHTGTVLNDVVDENKILTSLVDCAAACKKHGGCDGFSVTSSTLRWAAAVSKNKRGTSAKLDCRFHSGFETVENIDTKTCLFAN
jgi:hypothetical protein